MHLVDDRLVQWYAAPACIGPAKRGWIDDLGGAMRTFGLGARGRVGEERRLVIETEAIPRAGTAGYPAREIALPIRRQRDLLRSCFLDHCRDVPALRRPDPQMDSLGMKLGANRQAAGRCIAGPRRRASPRS